MKMPLSFKFAVILCITGLSVKAQLGNNKGDSFEISSSSGATINTFMHKNWLYRNTSGVDWFTASLHDAIAVDASFLTPGLNTRVWWERNPYTGSQSWGNMDYVAMGLYGSNLGIGTSNPQGRLHVAGTGLMHNLITIGNTVINTLDPYAADIVIGSDRGNRHDSSIMFWSTISASRISNSSDVFNFSVWNSSTPNVSLGAAAGAPNYFLGNILIGKTTQSNNNYKLDINGKARANELVVNSNGADFVFKEDYSLLSLLEIETFVKKNKHLPGIASAKTMQNEGVGVSDLQTKLLQKIEELTLHLIEKDKQLSEQAVKNKNYESRLRALEIIMKSKK